MSLSCCPSSTSSILYTNNKSFDFDQLEKHLLPESPENRWARLVCCWHEKTSDEKLHIHTYTMCFDRIEKNIYIDCARKKIFLKCAAQLILRPIYTLVKTIYHLSLGPVFFEIVEVCQGYQTKKECLKNSLKSMADIIRTPLYGMVLTIASIAVLIFGAIVPNTLYEGRMILGKIEQQSNWGQIHTAWTLARCFQPFPLRVLDYYGEKECRDDTFCYSEDRVEKGLMNFARSQIRFLRRTFDPFSCHRLGPQEIYSS